MNETLINLNAPASKSLSHRALLAAGLARGVCELENVLDSEDIRRTRDCLEALGAGISGQGSSLSVNGLSGNIISHTSKPVRLDVGESGTTCRLMAAIVAAGRGIFEISGRGRMHERPIHSLAQSLESQGVVFNYLDRFGCPPLRIETKGLPGGEITVFLEESSQYLSGVLLAATMAGSALTIGIGGQKVVSWPYVSLTLQVMESFGITPEVQVVREGMRQDVHSDGLDCIKPGAVRFIVRPGMFSAVRYRVEGDFSNASYLLAAGAVGEHPVVVSGLDEDSRQGDRRILDILRLMGAEVERGGQGILVRKRDLQAVHLDMGTCPDLVPTVAVMASMSRGKTVITNVRHLRIKESDRLAGVYNEISRTGCTCTLKEDGLEIESTGIPQGGTIEFRTYGDHRMAMSLSLYELAGIKVVLDNPGCVNKSFPGFWDEWSKVRRAYNISA